MIVAKFGGTSVANATALRQVDSVVRSMQHESGGVIVVLSATSGTTSQLLDIVRHAGAGRPYTSELDDVVARHEQIANELVGSADCIHALLTSVREFADAVAELGEWNDATLDAFVAFGELLSTTIYHSYRLSAGQASAWVDARKLIVTDDRFQRASVDSSATAALCHAALDPLCADGSVVVTQGFIASSSDGMTTTLGRGGSDYSAAIIGASIHARSIRIYTDVSGVYSCDPRLVPEAQPLAEIMFDEMRDMALFGAKVLHPDTIAPAVRASIPVHVLNTFRPDDPGTVITANAPTQPIMHAVSILRNVETITAPTHQCVGLLQNDVLRAQIIASAAVADQQTILLHVPDKHTASVLDSYEFDAKIHRQAVSIVAITGQMLTNPATIELISRHISHCADSLRVLAVSETCVVCVVRAEQADTCIRALHDLIIHQRDSDE